MNSKADIVGAVLLKSGKDTIEKIYARRGRDFFH